MIVFPAGMITGAAADGACAWVWLGAPPLPTALLPDPPAALLPAAPFGVGLELLLPPELSVEDEGALGFVQPMKKESARSRTTQSKRADFTQPPCAQNSDVEFVPEQLCLEQYRKRTMH